MITREHDRRPLGRNGPEITRVGRGTWAIGGPWAYGWGPQDDDTSVAAILRAGMDQIDLYQFHWPDRCTSTLIEDSWGEVGRLADEGLVRWVGLCNFNVGLLERAEAIRHVDSVQAPVSLLRRDAANDVIPWARGQGSGVIAYGPMRAGILTDSFSAARVVAMHEGDWRRHSPFFSEPELGRSLAFPDALRPIAARHGVPLAAVAIAWVLAWPGVTGAIVGARDPGQVDGWSAALGLTRGREELEEIAGALEATGAGSGPVDWPGT